MISVTPMSDQEYYLQCQVSLDKEQRPAIAGYRVVDENGQHWWPKARFESLWKKLTG